MTPPTRITPQIGDPPPKDRGARVSRKEVLDFLSRKGLPVTKKTRKRARNRIKRRKQRQLLPRGKDVSISQTDAPFQVVYGECIVGGIITFLHQTNTKQWLNHIISLAGHEINSIEELYIDGNAITFSGGYSGEIRKWATGGTKPDGNPIDYSNKVFLGFKSGSDSQAAQPDAVSVLGSYWTSNHRQRGVAHAYVILVWDAALFGEGSPDISFKVKGKKLYDPRTTTTAYSNNAALVIRDYLTDSKIGLGIDSSKIDDTSFSEAADVCDENVTLAAGGTEKRYTINGYFDVSEDKDGILDEMIASCSGRLFYSEGKWKLRAGEYRAPIMTLTEADLVGVPVIESLVEKSENFNGIRGKYVSVEKNFTVTEYPAIAPSAYLSEDQGRRVWADVDFPFVTSGSQAQRLALIELNSVRKKYRVGAPFRLRAIELEPGDTVSLTLPRFGFSAEPFEVTDTETALDQDGSMYVDLVLEQTGSDVFAWNANEIAINTPTSLSLPDVTDVADPTSFSLASGTTHLYIRTDGTIVPRIYASWTAPDDPFVTNGGTVQVQFKRSSSSAWIDFGFVEGSQTFVYLTDVQEGVNFDVRIRSINAIGVRGDWVTVLGHPVVGKTQPPSDVTGFAQVSEESGIRLSWTGISDADLREYELRFGGANWGASTLIARTNSTSYLWAFQVAGATTVRIKAIDTSGNYSANDATIALNVSGPNPVRTLTAWARQQSVGVDWETPDPSDFAVRRYEVYKGEDFGTAELLGTVDVTFFAYVERTGGTFTYWVRAIDEAGNRGTALSVSTTVVEPNDFRIRSNLNPGLVSAATSNALVAETESTFHEELEDMIAQLSPVLYLDADRGVTVDAQNRVSSWVAQDSNGYDATQGTAASRPFLTRDDNRGNWLPFSHSVQDWLQDAVSVTGSIVTSNAGNANHRVRVRSLDVAGGAGINGKNYRLTVRLKRVNHDWFFVGAYDGGTWFGVRVNIDTGTIDASFSVVSSSATIDSDGFCVVDLEFTHGTTTGYVLAVVTFGDSSITQGGAIFNATGSEQVEVAFASCRNADWSNDIVQTEGLTFEIAGHNGHKGIWFDGLTTGGSHLTISNASSPELTITGDLTMIALITPRLSTRSGDNYMIMIRRSGGNGYWCELDDSTLQAQFNTESGSVTTQLSDSSGVVHNEAQIVSAVIDSTSKLYRNGSEVDSDGSINAPGSTGSPTYIGFPTDNFGGLIHKLLIFDSALSDIDRQTIENAMIQAFRTESVDRMLDGSALEPGFYAPVDPAESWEDHFLNNSANSFQDLIDAGFSHYLQPQQPTTGYVERLIDLGLTVGESFVDLTWEQNDFGSPGTVSSTIWTSADGVNFTEYTGASQVFVSSVRFIRFRLTVSGGVHGIGPIRLKLTVQQDEETLSAELLAADVGGTEVSFVKNWLDVENISPTAFGTSAKHITIDFSDVANPTSFRALAWDQNGNRVDCSASFRVRGALSAT